LKKKIFIYLLLCIIFISCFKIPDSVIVNQYDLIHYNHEDLFYSTPLFYYQKAYYDPFVYRQDSNGVILSLSNNTTLYYNPGVLSAKGIDFFTRFTVNNDSIYLDYSQKQYTGLKSIMDENGLFEYQISWHHKADLLNNPWYSGLAQGQALSFLARLAYFTEDEEALNLAHKVYRTLDYNSDYSKEVTVVDKNSYAWIEEYPAEIPDHTLNGFLFGVFGLYDYYNYIDSGVNVQNLLSAYLTTIHDNMNRFRNPGGISYYCLKHLITNPSYHMIHIRQFEYLSKITGDSSFTKFADTLRVDYWDPDW